MSGNRPQYSRCSAANRQFLQAGRALLVAVALLEGAARGEENPSATPIQIGERLPYGQQPIDYFGTSTTDAVARLADRLATGEVTLEHDGPNGYLRSLLQALDVPPESQMLVFSRTALNQNLVGPKNPRAVYFNDSVSVGWVPGAASIELTALDPHKGAMFYTLVQKSESATPRLQREERCLACHAGSSSLQVPGWLARSFLTDEDGNPREGYSPITHALDVSKRFGGWYATGADGVGPHLGNLVGPDDNARHKREAAFRGTVPELQPFFDTSQYVSPHSDVVAQLVLHHQAHGLNLLVRAGYEHRLGRRSDAEEQLLRYLLFADEAPLAGPIEGTSGFREWFERQGPTDARGRSLRQFDLATRLFRYRLSYLIYSPVFEGLPAEVKQRLYNGMHAVLTGDPPPGLPEYPPDERSAVLRILRATKPDWPYER